MIMCPGLPGDGAWPVNSPKARCPSCGRDIRVLDRTTFVRHIANVEVVVAVGE
jgi:hypothetical protein